MLTIFEHLRRGQRKSRNLPLSSLCALMAGYRVNFTFTNNHQQHVRSAARCDGISLSVRVLPCEVEIGIEHPFASRTRSDATSCTVAFCKLYSSSSGNASRIVTSSQHKSCISAARLKQIFLKTKTAQWNFCFTDYYSMRFYLKTFVCTLFWPVF